MKRLTTTALALVLASGTAYAGSHSSDDETTMQNDTQMNSETAQSDSGNQMQNDTQMASDSDTMQTESDTEMAMGDGEYTSDDLWNERANLIRTRDITGGNVYTTNEAYDEGEAWDAEAEWTEVGADWNQIGEIEDIVLSKDGKMTGIVAEVGGFLDIGDKHVLISLDDVNLVAVDDQTYAYVTRLSEEELEGMNGVDEGFWN
jgi:hypothetical protein